MKAYQLTAWQSPPEMREVVVPEPEPGEVLVKVAAPVPATRICT